MLYIDIVRKSNKFIEHTPNPILPVWGCKVSKGTSCPDTCGIGLREGFKKIKFKKLAFDQLGRTPLPPSPQVGSQNFETF